MPRTACPVILSGILCWSRQNVSWMPPVELLGPFLTRYSNHFSIHLYNSREKCNNKVNLPSTKSMASFYQPLELHSMITSFTKFPYAATKRKGINMLQPEECQPWQAVHKSWFARFERHTPWMKGRTMFISAINYIPQSQKLPCPHSEYMLPDSCHEYNK